MKSFLSIVFAFLVAAGCNTANEQAATETTTLTLATTTSTRDSGLLDKLVPMFEKETGIEVKVVAVGSGQALELGRRGDADVLLTHAPEAEDAFIADGHGDGRRGVMHNDYVLVGPTHDPAQVKGSPAIEALRMISDRQVPFVSRSDESGTHMKERMLWIDAGIDPQGEWYFNAGSAMAASLRMASEKQAYTLADRGTFLAQQETLELEILSASDPMLRNPYSVIVVNPEKHEGVNAVAGEQFAEFLISEEAQQVIEQFGVEAFGQPLFFPDANK